MIPPPGFGDPYLADLPWPTNEATHGVLTAWRAFGQFYGDGILSGVDDLLNIRAMGLPGAPLVFG